MSSHHQVALQLKRSVDAKGRNKANILYSRVPTHAFQSRLGGITIQQNTNIKNIQCRATRIPGSPKSKNNKKKERPTAHLFLHFQSTGDLSADKICHLIQLFTIFRFPVIPYHLSSNISYFLHFDIVKEHVCYTHRRLEKI